MLFLFNFFFFKEPSSLLNRGLPVVRHNIQNLNNAYALWPLKKYVDVMFT